MNSIKFSLCLIISIICFPHANAGESDNIFRTANTNVSTKKDSIRIERVESIDALGRYTHKSRTIIEMETMTNRPFKKRNATNENNKKEIWI